MKRYLFFVFAVCVLTFAVTSSNAAPKNDSPAPLSQTPPAAKASHENTLLSGKVAETMNGGGYTYVAIEKNGKKTWVAMPETKVKVGQEVSCKPGMVMANFTSKTLKRTFDSVVFSEGII